MSIPSTERMTAIADKGAQPTSVEVNHVLRELVQVEIDRLDRAEKAPNDALTPYGRFTRVCLKRWLSWLDLPNTRDQLGNVARIVAAMEHDFLRNPPPPRDDIAAVIPMRDVLTLYRVACGWIGHEPRVTKLEIEEKSERVAFCGQHFGSVDHPNRYVCELLSGHEGLHAAPSVNLRQHAEPVRMEMLGGGLMAEIGPLVIGEEIAQQLNAGIEPATGKGAVNFELKKVIRIDDLPEPSREECEADAKLHEEIVGKLAEPDPDEVRRQVEEYASHWLLGNHNDPYHITLDIPTIESLVNTARAWVKERREVEILNEIAIWGERFCTSGRYEPTMMPQRGLYRALRRLQAVRNGDAVPPPFPEPDLSGNSIEEQHVRAVDEAPEDVVTECEATDSKGERLCHHAATVQLCHYHGRLWEVVEDASSQLARIAEYIASQPVSRFPGAAGRDVADVVIDALRASGEQRGGVLLEAKPAQDPETTRVVVAAAVLGHLLGHLHHPTSADFGLRAAESRAALAWADSLIEESRRAKR